MLVLIVIGILKEFRVDVYEGYFNSLAAVARALGRNENSVRSIWKNRDTIRKSVELSGTSQGYLRRADPGQLLSAKNRPERLRRKAERRRQKRAAQENINAMKNTIVLTGELTASPTEENSSYADLLSQISTPSNEPFAVLDQYNGIEILDHEEEIKIETVSDQDDDPPASNVAFLEIE